MQPISREGIKVFNPKIGTKREEATTNADKALFDKIDKNKDGVIDAKEFWGHHSDLYPIFRHGIDGKTRPTEEWFPSPLQKPSLLQKPEQKKKGIRIKEELNTFF